MAHLSGGEAESPGTRDQRQFDEFVDHLEGRTTPITTNSGTEGEVSSGQHEGSSRSAEGSGDAVPGSGSVGGAVQGSSQEEGAPSSRAMEGGEEAAGGKAGKGKSKRTPHQLLLSRLSQRRYRERQKHKKSQMEAIAASLADKTALLEHVQQENAALRAMNYRFEAVLKEQQSFIAVLQEGGQPNPASVPMVDFGGNQQLTITEGGLAGLQLPSFQPSLQLDPVATYLADVPAPGRALPSSSGDPTSQLGAQIQALRSFLEANSIFMGGIQPSEQGAQVLATLLSAAAKAVVDGVTFKAPKPSDMASTRSQPLEADLSPEDLSKFQKCLTIMNPSRSQKDAMMELRSRHLERLRSLYSERATLNSQGRKLLQELGSGAGSRSEDMKSVWNLLKQSVAQEHATIVDALRTLLFGILDPVQASLLLVESYPGGVDVVKLTAALMSLRGDSSGTTAEGSSPPKASGGTPLWGGLS